MKTWKISDIGVLLKNSFTAIMKGEFLLRLNVGKYFIHIIQIMAFDQSQDSGSFILLICRKAEIDWFLRGLSAFQKTF